MSKLSPQELVALVDTANNREDKSEKAIMARNQARHELYQFHQQYFNRLPSRKAVAIYLGDGLWTTRWTGYVLEAVDQLKFQGNGKEVAAVAVRAPSKAYIDFMKKGNPKPMKKEKLLKFF